MTGDLPIILVGRVKDTADPDKFGRVQVEIDTYTGKLILPWLRILHSTASTASGSHFLPEVGDEVVILRGDGANPDGMIILGCVYGGTERLPQKKKKPGTAGEPPTELEPIEEDGKNNFKTIISRAGHEILLDDTDDKGLVRVSSGDGKMAITMDVTAKMLTVYAADAMTLITPKDMTIQADTSLTIETKDLVVNASGDTTITATGDFTAEGANATITGSSSGTFDGGGNVTIKGGAIKMGK